MENFIISLRCVIPMFLTLCTGFFARKWQVIPADAFPHLSTLSFQVLLPCLLFYNVYSADLHTAVQPKLLIFLVGWTLCWFLLAYIFYTVTEPNPRRRGAFIQNAYRSNIAVIGVSLAQSLMDADGIAALSLSISVLVPTFNVLAVITLETCRGGGVDAKHTLLGIAKNPLIRGCVLGILCLVLGIHLPSPVEQAVKSLGSAGSTMTLIALGASFQFQGLRKNLRPVAISTAIRLVLTPLLALSLALILGFRGSSLGVVLICLGTPTAASAYSMALACDSDHELTAQLVVTTSLFCSLTMFLWIFLLKQLGLL
jgi:hypothetical protein